jgi:hypothetical protein
MELDAEIHHLLVRRCSQSLAGLLNDMRLQLRILQLVTGESDLASQPDKLYEIVPSSARARSLNWLTIPSTTTLSREQSERWRLCPMAM